MTLKEIHAYKNEDGTFRIHTIGEENVCDQPHIIKGMIPRAKLTIEALTEQSTDEIFTLEVKDDE